jgi:uncharacterized protein (DUF2141 family)
MYQNELERILKPQVKATPCMYAAAAAAVVAAAAATAKTSVPLTATVTNAREQQRRQQQQQCRGGVHMHQQPVNEAGTSPPSVYCC